MKRFILLTIVLFISCCISHAQDESTKIEQYILTINKLEDSTPEQEGRTQQEYDQWLGSLYLNLAMEYYSNYQFEDVLSATEKSISYFKKSNDIDYHVFAAQLIAAVARHLKRYDLAAETLSEVLDIVSELDDNDYMAKILLNYFTVAKEQGDASKVHQILVELQSFEREALSQSVRLDMIHHDINYSLSIGDIDLAYVYLEEYRQELEKMSEEDKADNQPIYLNYEVRCHDKAGRYEESLNCYERQVKSDVPTPSEIYLYTRALYYSAYTDNSKKFDEYIEKINALKDSPAISNAKWMEIRIQMIIALMRLKRYEEALDCVKEMETLGKKNEWLFVYKGGVLYRLGRYDEARDVYKEYLEICRTRYGAESLKYADALRYLANIEGFCNDIDSGSEHLIESLRLVQNIVKNELPYIPFDRLEEYWSDVSTGIEAMAAYSVEAGITQGDLTVAAYEGLVLCKGLLLSSEKSFKDYVDDSDDEDLKALYGETLALREKMEGLKKSYSENKAQISELQPLLTLKESTLSQYGTGLSDYTEYLDVTYSDLRNSLKRNEVVIDFVDHESEKYGRKYLAFVYKRGWKAPMLVQVCTQKDLDKYLNEASRPDAVYNRQNSSELLKLLWKPLEKYVDKGNVVYVIPSGDLHLVSFDSFQHNDGSLLGSKYDFIRLSSARELLSGVSDVAEIHDAVLYGGLQYDLNSDDRIAEAGKHRKASRQFASRGGRRSGGEKFDILPMSEREVEIASALLKNGGVLSRCYKGKEGTEESFMEIGVDKPSYDIIHMATHGFYYTPSDAAKITGLSGYKSAMMLSGLVMAGGNAEWMGERIPENTLGGILTAADIAKCDLSGTDLVVLTACDTGKGKVTSEGVYGIQRAFKKAGAKTIIMNLWSTNDKAAMDFMDYFYTALSTNGWDKRSAFMQAKDKMREKYRSPYYWAGFFMLD